MTIKDLKILLENYDENTEFSIENEYGGDYEDTKNIIKILLKNNSVFYDVQHNNGKIKKFTIEIL